MKYFLYILVALAGYLTYYYANFRLVLKQAANPPIIQLNREFGNGPTLTYVAAGDSTALGTGASKVENTYPYKIAEFLAVSNTVHYKNIGVSGARIDDLIISQLPQIIAYQPDVVTISIGGNDADRLASGDYMLTRFKTIISELTAKTSATIYLANIPNFTGAKLLPTPYVWLIEARSRPLNTELVKLETERVKIANVHDFFGDSSDVPRTYSADFFHPSDFGYEYWTKAFLEKMK